MSSKKNYHKHSKKQKQQKKQKQYSNGYTATSTQPVKKKKSFWKLRNRTVTFEQMALVRDEIIGSKYYCVGDEYVLDS